MSAQKKLYIMGDFTNIYTGMKMVIAGEGAKLFDLELQATFQQEVMGGISFESGLLPYINPPYVALILSPLALLPLKTAYYIWSLCQLGLLIWMIFSINHLFLGWTKQEQLIMNITILAFWPLTITFLHGQFSLLLLICLLQLYKTMQKSQLTRAGFWLVLLSIKPQTILLPLMTTINKRYWRVFASAVIFGFSIVFLSALFLGFGTWRRYLQVLPTMNNIYGNFGFYPDLQYTFRGVITNIFGYSQANLINMISITVLLLSMFFVWLLWKPGIPEKSPRFTLYFAFTILLSTFFSLHSYPHDDLILVLPAILIYDYLRQKNFPRYSYCILILVSPLVFFFDGFSQFKFFNIIQPSIILILIFLSWVIYYINRDFKIGKDNSDTLAL